MQAKNGILKEVSIPLLLLLALRVFIQEEVFFILSAIYFICLIIKNGEIYFPELPGLRLYTFFILYATFVGFYCYSTYNVLRDLLYILPSVLWIFIGYHLCKFNADSEISILKTMYVYGGLLSTKCIITFAMNFTTNFNDIRTIFNSHVYEIGIILAVLIYQVCIESKVVFSHKTDIFLISLLTLHILLSFGRISTFVPLIIVFIMLCLNIKFGSNKTKIMSRVTILIGAFLLIALIVYFVIPNEIIDIMANKLSTSFTEIDASQKVNSTDEAMSNWRGYEIQSAAKQWRNANTFVKIFGGGMGYGIYINYVPYTWVNMVENNRIPLLHNGFFTVLAKGGIVGIFSLVLMFVGPIIIGLNHLIQGKGHNQVNILLVSISCACIAITYVVRGPIEREALIAWAAIVGWLSFYNGKKISNSFDSQVKL